MLGVRPCVQATRGVCMRQENNGRIDEVIEDIGDDWLVKEFLMERRRALHDQISVMIRFKMRTDKLCRNGAINPLWVEEPLLHLPHR